MRKTILFFLILAACTRERPHHEGEFSWAIQGQDPAIDGCPYQYHEYAGDFLIGCWGTKEPEPAAPVVCKQPVTRRDGFVYCLSTST